jgi:hypothetical protein
MLDHVIWKLTIDVCSISVSYVIRHTFVPLGSLERNSEHGVMKHL